MWLPLFIFAFMLAIIFFQAIQGTFSALIMAVLSVFSATLALGAHEEVAQKLLQDLLGDYAYPVAFGGIFAVTLVVLRLLLDKIIPRDTLLPGIVDRAGGLAFGILTGFIAAGAIGITVQMIPFGREILGFSRFDDEGNRRGLWLAPDAFTVHLCSYLAESTLSGDHSWRRDHPDFLTHLDWVRNTESTGSRITVEPGSVRATQLLRTEQMYEAKLSESGRRGQTATYTEIQGPPAGMQWVVVKVTASEGARDSDGSYRFSPTQVRLVGDSLDGKRVMQYVLRGVGQIEGRYVTATSVKNWGNKTGEFQFVFEVPVEGFKPRFVEFKRGGRASLPEPAAAGAAPAPGAEVQPVTEAPARPPTGGALVPIRPQAGSKFDNHLPMVVQRYDGIQVQLGAERSLRSGHLVAQLDAQSEPDPAGAGPIEMLTVPEGKRLLQLDVEAVHARSLPGTVVNLTRQVLAQYKVIDESGEQYFPVGRIAAGTVSGERIMEVQYLPEDAINGRLPELNRIRHSDLTGDYQLIYLFLIPPGKKIVTFDAGGRTIDIADLGLTS